MGMGIGHSGGWGCCSGAQHGLLARARSWGTPCRSLTILTAQALLSRDHAEVLRHSS